MGVIWTPREWQSQPPGAVNAARENQITRYLLGAWSLGSKTWQDSTGVNNGILNAGVTWSVRDKGIVATFNGTSGNVTLPTPPAGSTLTAKNHTIALWIYPTSVTGLHTIFHQWNTVVGPIIFSNGTDLLWQVGSSANARLTGTACIAANVWQHIACTYTSTSDLKIYKNGALFASQTTPTANNTAHTVAAVFGDCNVGGAGYFAGDMAMPAMWGRELSAWEIRSLYLKDWQLFEMEDDIISTSAAAVNNLMAQACL